MRLDQYLTKFHNIQSRNKAQELIKAGLVSVDHVVIRKSSFEVEEENKIVLTESRQYVSRGGHKLAGFLQNSGYVIEQKHCLDIGSSTGGFVQVLLEKGAAQVSAVDVGSEQLHPSLRNDPRITLYENTDIREFTCKEPFALVTCDVSFIGITDMLPVIDALSCDMIILLFKPQFEVGRDAKRTGKGVVKDDAAVNRAKRKFESAAFSLGWELLESKESTIKGKEGNAETFYAFKKRRG